LKKVDIDTLFGLWPYADIDISLERLLQVMRENDVRIAVTTSVRGFTCDFEGGNDDTLTAAADHAELIPAATIDPRQCFHSSEEVRRMIDREVKLFRFFPFAQEWPIHYSPFEAILRELDEYDEVVVMIPASAITSQARLGDVTTIEECVSKYGFRTVLLDVNYPAFAETILAMKRNSNLYVETRRLMPADALERFVDEIGEERILFGSGAPLKSIRSAVKPIEASSLTREQKQKILCKNASKLLRL